MTRWGGWDGVDTFGGSWADVPWESGRPSGSVGQAEAPRGRQVTGLLSSRKEEKDWVSHPHAMKLPKGQKQTRPTAGMPSRVSTRHPSDLQHGTRVTSVTSG